MDKRVLRERMRRKKRQMMIRHYTKIGLSVLGLILAIVFVVRGIIIPIAHHVAGGGSSNQTVQAQADTEEVQANSDAAVMFYTFPPERKFSSLPQNRHHRL